MTTQHESIPNWEATIIRNSLLGDRARAQDAATPMEVARKVTRGGSEPMELPVQPVYTHEPRAERHAREWLQDFEGRIRELEALPPRERSLALRDLQNGLHVAKSAAERRSIDLPPGPQLDRLNRLLLEVERMLERPHPHTELRGEEEQQREQRGRIGDADTRCPYCGQSRTSVAGHEDVPPPPQQPIEVTDDLNHEDVPPPPEEPLRIRDQEEGGGIGGNLISGAQKLGSAAAGAIHKVTAPAVRAVKSTVSNLGHQAMASLAPTPKDSAISLSPTRSVTARGAGQAARRTSLSPTRRITDNAESPLERMQRLADETCGWRH